MGESWMAGFPTRSFFVGGIFFLSLMLHGCGDSLATADDAELSNHPFAHIAPAAEHPLQDDESEAPQALRGSLQKGDHDSNSMFETLGDLQAYVRYQKSHKSALNTVGTIGIFGGFNTCTKVGPFGSQVYTRTLKTLWQKAKQGQFYRIVASCFRKSGKSIYYVSSSDLDTVRWGVPSDIAAVLTYESHLAAKTDVYLFGHSYGGWLAVRTALDLPKAITIKGIASIDPISRTYCTPSVFINAYLSSTFSFNPSSDCTRAPRDFSASDTLRLRERAGWWHNFHQDNDGFIHSSYMTNASNKYIDYDYVGVFAIGSAHMDMDSDERVWSVFEHKI